ncbi:hypothetical protein ACHAXH_008193 [Discostella pseudostelligera]
MSMNHPISRTASPTGGVLSSLSFSQLLFAFIFTLGRLASSPEVLLVESFSTCTSSYYRPHHHPHHHYVVGHADIRGRLFQLNSNIFSKVLTISSLLHHQHHQHHISRSRGSFVALQSTDTNSIETEGNDIASTTASASLAAEVALKAMQSETPRLTYEDKAFVSFLYNNQKANENNNDNDQSSSLENAISDSLETMSPSLLVALQMAAKTEEWNEEEDGDDGNTGDDDTLNFEHQMVQVGKVLQNVLDTRLVSGRALLTQLLNSGEIRKLDSLIGKAAKEGKLDMSFFSVLSMNIQDAAMEDSGSNNSNNNDEVIDTASSLEMEKDGGSSAPGGSANRAQILQHIYTRCQEELEKNVPPGMGLLNKLLRTEISSIRTNQLQYYLGPQATSITSPDGKTIELSNGTGGKALVSHGEFIDALSQAVNQIRTLEKAGGTDRLSAMNLIENIRRVAMEARVVLVDCYGEGSEVVIEFQRDLQPVFRPTSGSG